MKINFDKDYQMVMYKMQSDFGWENLEGLDDNYKDLLNDTIKASKDCFIPIFKNRLNNEGSISLSLDDMTLINRVEVIDEKGRSYVNWKQKNKVELQVQDNGRTLKVFISQNNI